MPEADGVGHEVRVHGAHADSGVVDQYVDAAEAGQHAVDASGEPHARKRLLVLKAPLG